MPDHPWFKGIVDHRWTREQIILGEIQHYLRVRTNPIFFGYIVTNVASDRNYDLMDVVMENFMEELGGERTHVDIMLQFLEEAGITREQADRADPAPGTLAAIEMIRSGCQNRTALEGVALLAYVEAMHGGPVGDVLAFVKCRLLLLAAPLAMIVIVSCDGTPALSTTPTAKVISTASVL